MRKEPKFILAEGRVYMISVTKRLGQIVGIDGVYQCISDPGVGPEALVTSMVSLLHEALHSSAPLKLEDFPEEEQEKLRDLLGISPQSTL